MSAPNFDRHLHRTRTWIDESFRGWLPRLRWHSEIEKLAKHVFIGAGKCVRPGLVFWTEGCLSGDFGTPSRAALDVAVALEMIHTYSLVHDDLPAMDDDDFRRGRPTAHRLAGDAMATLLGDALLTGAFEVLALSGAPTDLRLFALRELAVAAGGTGMIAGQVDDLRSEGLGVRGDLALLEQIHNRKTGALIAASVTLGWALGGGVRDPQIEAAREWGLELGLFFQIIDDLIDALPGTGKSQGKDERQEKLTYLTLLGAEGARREAARRKEALVERARQLGLPPERTDELLNFLDQRTL